MSASKTLWKSFTDEIVRYTDILPIDIIAIALSLNLWFRVKYMINMIKWYSA